MSRGLGDVYKRQGYDMLNADNGTYDSWYWSHPPMYMPENCNLTDVAHIKQFVDIPVVCAGRMNPEIGAKAIADGKIDAIGVARPVSVLVETFGTGVVSDEALEQAVEQVFDLRPTAIIRDLDLRKPIYRQLAAYGHMGREDLGVSWEKTDRVDALKAALQ